MNQSQNILVRKPLPKITWILALICATVTSFAAAAEGPRLGKPANRQEIAAWNLTVFPDGKGLPPGHGSAVEGKAIYERHCASCHGNNGLGGSGEELAGAKHRLIDSNPDKTIGTYWPTATTLFDFVRRSMPPDAPGSLSNDQIYAVCAYLLHLNGIIPESSTLNAVDLPKVKMPNREGFIRVDAPK
ncbi:MAG: cytochrome c [Proteobacteria bacterium]|nr:cytochrome c [Pseudomonadota bacterium]